jgi:urea transport system permease protein
MRKTVLLTCLYAALVVASSMTPAAAQTLSFKQTLQQLNVKSYSKKAKAVKALGRTGDPRAVAVLEALAAGLLFARKTDQRVLILPEDKAKKTLDPLTGKPVAVTAAELRKIRVNNRVRRAVKAALGGLTLLSPDPAVRRKAAQAIFKARDPAALPGLNQALARETDQSLKALLAEARAALILNSDVAAAEKLAAVKLLAGRRDRQAVAILSGIAARDGEVAKAARDAVRRIESDLAFWNNMQNVVYGLSLGSVLLLAAIGLAITFGVMGVINMAHGEMVMIGAYVTFVVQEVIRTSAPHLFDVSLLIALPLAFVVAGAIGIAIERSIIRWLYGRPLETLLATWGLSLILQQATRSIFGPNNREVGTPSFMQGSFELGHLAITYNRLYIILFVLAVFAVLLVVLRRTALGLQMRAVTQDRRMASAMGIRTARVDALTFGLGSGIAGIAGVALSQIENVSPNLGQAYIIDSFMVVVFGGVGNLWGTFVGAFTLGIANKFLEPYAGAVLGKILVLVLIILFIQKRPRGLFALKGRAVDA